MKDLKELIEIPIDGHVFTENALSYLGKNGVSRIKKLYKDTSTNNWLMALVDGNYYVSLANDNGCKSSVFGSVSHTLSLYKIK